VLEALVIDREKRQKSTIAEERDSSELWAVVEGLAQQISQCGIVVSSTEAAKKRISNEALAGDVVRLAYFLAISKKASQRDKDKAIKSLLVLAIALGAPLPVKSGRQKVRRRLLRFMPTDPMEDLLRKLSSHPLYERLEEWNENRPLISASS
jgi:hypothetical protein